MERAVHADLIAACAAAVACGWNLTSVGAVASGLSAHHDASLGAIGLLGSGLWLTHAMVQAPAGVAVDRFGVRQIAVLAMVLLLALNVLALLATSVVVLGVVRALTGLGCGTTMVCASMRVRGAGAVGQGAVGGAVSAGGALGVAAGPALLDLVGWCAPFVGGAVLAALAIPAAAAVPSAGVARRPRRTGPHTHARAGSRTALAPYGAVLGLTIVLSFSLGNWITTILDRVGAFGPIAAGLAGATVVAGSVVTRPLGGVLVARGPARADLLVVAPLVAAAAGALVLAFASGAAVVLVGMVVVGLAAGLPFAAVVHATLRSAPAEQAGAAVGFVGTLGTLGGVVAIAALGPAVDAGAVREVFAVLAAMTLAIAARYATRPPAGARGV